MLPSLTIKSLRAGGNYSFSSGERKYIPYPEFPTIFRAVKFLLRLSGQERQLWQLLTLRLTSDLSDCRPPARLSIRHRDLCQQLIRQKNNRRSAWQGLRLGHQVVTSFSWVVKEWFPRRRLPRAGAGGAIRNLVMYRSKGEHVIQVLIVLPLAGRGEPSQLAYE